MCFAAALLLFQINHVFQERIQSTVSDPVEGAEFKRAEVKTIQRTYEKVVRRLHGDFGRCTDLVRCKPPPVM